MKKFYRILLLLITFIFLSTYTSNKIEYFKGNKIYLFKIKNIEIINNKIISKNEIDKKLKHLYGKSIFFIKKNDFEKPLQAINFFEKAEVKKKYPNRILIKIYETKPVAILFKKNEKYLLDNLANVIDFNKSIFTDTLPNIFGENAEKNYIDFNKILEKNSFPKKKIKSYYFFQIGRWDIKLTNNRIIKFPSYKTEEAVKKSIELIDREDFKKYNIIDLRMRGKIVVE